MTDDPISRKLREISWRRELTPSEQAELDAWLKRHPEARGDWETDVALSGTLGRLTGVAVSSNFTSRVLQAVEGQMRAETRGRGKSVRWRNWMRRSRWVMGSSFAGVILTMGLAIHHHEVVVKRQELVKTIVVIGGVAALPNTEVLTNFEAIRLLSQGPQPDEQLLALLQ
jgi:anti-sigma factor RsiW